MQEKKIKSILLYRDLKIGDLADKLGKSIQNLSTLLKRDNFREKELEDIATALGCRLEIRFIDLETGKEF